MPSSGIAPAVAGAHVKRTRCCCGCDDGAVPDRSESVRAQPPKAGATKEKKAAAASAGGKAKKKKGSKGKQKEKLNGAVFFDKNLYEKLKKEVPNYKLITPSIISERMRCNVSMARRAINDLLLKGMIKIISKHQKQCIYTRALAGAD